jgi:fructose-specific phosphotransferase system IIA component
MEIIELFDESTINLDLQGETKDEIISEMVELLDQGGVLADKEAYKKEIYAREAMSTTGLGFDIAIPHAKTAAVKTPRVAFGKSAKGFDFQSEDGKDAHLIFMIAATDTDSNLHLQALATLSRNLIKAPFRTKLLEAKTAAEVMEVLKEI